MITTSQTGKIRRRPKRKPKRIRYSSFLLQLLITLTVHAQRSDTKDRIKNHQAILLLKETKQERRILVLQKPETDPTRKQRIQHITTLSAALTPKPQRRHAIRLRHVQLMQQTRRTRINHPNNMQQQTTSHITRKKRQNRTFLCIHLQTNLNRQLHSTPIYGIAIHCSIQERRSINLRLFSSSFSAVVYRDYPSAQFFCLGVEHLRLPTKLRPIVQAKHRMKLM